MCELLAFSGKRPQPINHILEAFYKRSPYHPHGWGLGLFREGRSVVQKEPVRALDSHFLRRQLSRPQEYQNVLGHIRFATVGFITKENTHPFIRKDASGREWIFIHNGTIFSDEKIVPYEESQEGDTDSERVLMLLIDRINEEIKVKKSELTAEERFAVVDQLIKDLAQDNKLNLMIYDGEQFYIHVNTKDTMFYSDLKDGTLISTYPLEIPEIEDLTWQAVPMLQTHCYRDGKIVTSGSPHTHEYIPDPEVEKLLYLKYASL